MKSVLRAVTPPILWAAAKRLLGPIPQTDMSVFIGAVHVTLPPGHILPELFRQSKNYDQFLPHLAREMPAKSWVVDVGANCGDTLAAIASANSRLNFICIEADERYFSYLLRNIETLERNFPDTLGAIRAVKALAGTVSGKTVSANGSGHLVPAEGGELAVSLEEIVGDYRVAAADIALIKVDVDGFDYDVVESAGALLDGAAAMVYFECYLGSDEQKQGFTRLFEDMKLRGFRFLIFDRFGAPVIDTDDLHAIEHLSKYCRLQIEGRATHTTLYHDVLAYRPHQESIVEGAMKAFGFPNYENASPLVVP